MKKRLKERSYVYVPQLLDANGNPIVIYTIAGPQFIEKGTIVEINGNVQTAPNGDKYFKTDKGNVLASVLEDYTPLFDQAKSVERMFWIYLVVFVVVIFVIVYTLRKR